MRRVEIPIGFAASHNSKSQKSPDPKREPGNPYHPSPGCCTHVNALTTGVNRACKRKSATQSQIITYHIISYQSAYLIMSCISCRATKLYFRSLFLFVYIFFGETCYQRHVTVCQSVYDMSDQILKVPKDMERSLGIRVRVPVPVPVPEFSSLLPISSCSGRVACKYVFIETRPEPGARLISVVAPMYFRHIINS